MKKTKIGEFFDVNRWLEKYNAGYLNRKRRFWIRRNRF
jgi:hypothetical protein